MSLKHRKGYGNNFPPICCLVIVGINKCLVQYLIVAVLLHTGILLLDRLKAETKLDKREADVQWSYRDFKCFHNSNLQTTAWLQQGGESISYILPLGLNAVISSFFIFRPKCQQNVSRNTHHSAVTLIKHTWKWRLCVITRSYDPLCTEAWSATCI